MNGIIYIVGLVVIVVFVLGSWACAEQGRKRATTPAATESQLSGWSDPTLPYRSEHRHYPAHPSFERRRKMNTQTPQNTRAVPLPEDLGNQIEALRLS